MTLNRPQVFQALAQFFGIKGQPEPPGLSKEVWPSISVGDLIDSPYTRYAIGVAQGGTGAAVAAKLAYLLWRPGPAVVLQLKVLVFTNTQAGAQTFGVRLLTAADVASLTTAPSSITQMKDLGANPIGSPLRPSNVSIAADAAGKGTSVFTVRVPAGGTVILPLPAPGILLYGNDEGGVPALAIINQTTVNETIDAFVIGNEWPLPG